MAESTPTHPGADRNLLFGILALQMDFISRDALIQAMNAWVLDKAKALGQILRDQGALSEDNRALLEAVVQQHLKLHANNAEKSLASVSSLGSVRQDLEQIADADLHASLVHVATAHAWEARPQSTEERSAGRSTSAGTRFHILRPHAKGGLGQVYVAHDEELHRDVALKEIQERHADHPEYRARFLLEAEVTGGLEHPGIVPVYGLGQYADGRPFYAMRFVQGENLKRAIERFHQTSFLAAGERTLALRQLLGRFLDVCHAVAYAHNRRVLHRDLKPANILLGPYGETLVVDWGLAKPLDWPAESNSTADLPLRPPSVGAATPTEIGQMVGTLEYMSPEQAAGRLDQLGPASDVYSLGATLFTLLTGSAPFDRADEDVVQKVLRGDFSPPRRLKASVPAALEAICLKAMAVRLADRYASVRALADDLEHWLADEPVAVYRESLRDQLGRWVRRHKTLVSGAAALLVTTVMALSLGLVLLGREQARTQARRQEAEQEGQRADDNAQAAAEQRGLALETLQRVVFDIQKELKNRPGMQELRQKLLRQAQEGLQRLSGSAATRDASDHAMVHAFVQMGDLFGLLGSTEQARQQYKAAYHVAQDLVEANPHNAGARRDLFIAYGKLGDVNLRMDQVAAAQEAFGKQLELSQALAEADPHNTEAQRDLSIAYEKLGDVNLRLGQVAAAQEAYRKGLEISEALARADPKNAQAQRDLSIAYEKLGDVSMLRGQTASAQEAFRKDLELSQALAQADPKDAQAQRDLAAAYMRLGEVSLQLGQAAAAQEAYRKQLELFQGLAEADPKNTQAQRDLATAYEKLGDVSHQLGEAGAAQEAYRQQLKLSEALAQTDPQNAQFQRGLALAYDKLGDVSLQRGQAAEAQEAYRKTLEVLQALAQADPKNAQAQRDLAIAYDKLGEVSLQRGQAAEAQEAFGKFLKLYQPLVQADPQNALLKADLADVYVQLGDASLQRGQVEAAQQAYLQALAGRDKLAAEQPTNPAYQDSLARLLATCPLVSLRNPTRAVALAQQAVQLSPQAADYWNTLGIAHYRAGDSKAALQALEKALQFRGGQSADWFFLALAHGQQGHQQQARQCYDKGLVWMQKNAPLDRDLQRFRTEAADYLEVKPAAKKP